MTPDTRLGPAASQLVDFDLVSLFDDLVHGDACASGASSAMDIGACSSAFDPFGLQGSFCLYDVAATRFLNRHIPLCRGRTYLAAIRVGLGPFLLLGCSEKTSARRGSDWGSDGMLRLYFPRRSDRPL